MTSVELLRKPGQIQNSAPFQLGTSDVPCTIAFGLSHYDAGKSRRAVKINLNADQLETVKMFDEAAPAFLDIAKVTNPAYQPLVTVKVAGDTAITDSSGKQVKPEDLKYGMQCICIVRPYQWTMSGNKGVSFQCLAMHVLGKKQVAYKFC